MAHKSKRIREIAKLVDPEKVYKLEEAIDILQKCPPVKFDQSMDIAIKTSVDARKSEQQVRGTVSLPNGTGKRMVVLVFARGEKVKEALNAGADYAGADELIEKVKGGWLECNAIIATPDMMRSVGTLGKILGPRGLMPTPKAGNVTMEVGKAVAEVKGGKVEFKGDKNGVINGMVGKLSFAKEKLIENIRTFVQAVAKARPASAKGEFLRSLYLSSTMGPGLKIDTRAFAVEE